MHQEAEFGIAAHFIYKEKGSVSMVDHNIAWLQDLADVTEMHKDHAELVSSIKMDVFSDRIFVLTPQGDVIDLPIGSTPVDFAYRIHSDIGNRCNGAKVEDSIVPLHYELQNGDMVEILTKKDPGPNEYWLSFVKTSNARAKIKSWFLSQRKEDTIKRGKDILNRHLRRLGRPVLDGELGQLGKIDNKKLSLTERENILESIGNGFCSSKSHY